MLLDTLVRNIWLTLAIWTALYTSDYLLARLSARLLRAQAGRHLVFEKGIELTPVLQQDVASTRWLSPRFIIILLVQDGYLWYLWQSLVETSGAYNVYETVLGTLFLLEIAIHFKHIRNLVVFYHAQRSDGMDGTLRYAQWLSYRLSMVELLAFAGLFLLFFWMTDRWFFVGGAITTFLGALSHARYARKPKNKEFHRGDAENAEKN